MNSFTNFLAFAILLMFISACDQKDAQPDTAAIDAASGAYKTCAGCHGATGQGNRDLNAPSLVNLDGWYMERQIFNFREGIRGRHEKDLWGQQMSAQAAMLKDATAVEAVIAQVGSFENIVPEKTFDADTSRGKSHYNMTCGACHGSAGIGNSLLNAPSLRGIDDWYLVRQYQNFQDEIRGTDEKDIYGQQMQRMGHVLKTEDDIRNVAAWLLSLGIDD